MADAGFAVLRGISAAALQQYTVNGNGEVTGVETTIKLDYIQDHKAIAKVSERAAAASSEKIEGKAAGGIIVEYPKTGKRIDAAGNVVSTSSGSGGGGDVIGITISGLSKANYLAIVLNMDKPWRLAIKGGENADPDEIIDIAVSGYITSDIELAAGEEQVSPITVEITGASLTKASGVVDSALAWTPGAITPTGKDDPVTLTGVAAGDVPRLLTGKAVYN